MNTHIGRYAPSPTGPLHLGNLRTALLCWLHVRLHEGRLLLRMDDLDTPRNRPGAAERILDDLLWLGLDWDGDIIRQSERLHQYQKAFEQLCDSGAVFPCRCSRRELGSVRGALDPDLPSLCYPGTCRPENLSSPIIPDEPIAWRFRVEDRTLAFHDGVLGSRTTNLATYPGDFVIKRKDGVFAYHLASVVDDGFFGVSDVVRGADLSDSSARQIALFRSLGYPVPRFWHVPLMRNSAGIKLSKRDGADSLDSLRTEGITRTEIIGMLGASLGLCEPGTRVEPAGLLEGLTPDFLQHFVERDEHVPGHA